MTAGYTAATKITKLFVTVNKDLGEFSQWFNANKLKLNIKKTKYIYVVFFHIKDL